MIRVDIKRTKFFNELDVSMQKKFFISTAHKFIHNIDTFYYSAFIKDDCKGNDDENMLCFISKLKFLKDEVIDKNEPVYYLEDVELKLIRKSFSLYEFCLSVEGMFDIFVSKYIPNNNTPRIVIQLRSIGLWLEGTEELIYRSYSVLERVLSEFDLSIDKTRENRIDFCYHTNSIQGLHKVVNDTFLKRNVNTSLRKYSKVGDITDESITVDYLSLGKRQSNNLFVRLYNKTREVIEMNYKAFFIDYWFKHGLISFYDKFCYEYAYKYSSYNSLVWGRIDFYLKYGTDYKLKQDLELLKQDYSTNLDYVRKFIKGKLPDITLIVNIEYQCMRKFFYYSDDIIESLNHNSKIPKVDRLFKIIDNRKLFLDYLTSDTLSFVKTNYKSIIESLNKQLKSGLISDIEYKNFYEGIYLSWWQRLRKLKLKSLISDTKFIRDYSKNLDFDKLKTRFKSNIASMSLYIDCDSGTSLHNDLSSVICSLNDNDMITDNCRIVSNTTGEIINLDSNNIDYDYDRIKEKKKKSLNSLLKKAESETPKQPN